MRKIFYLILLLTYSKVLCFSQTEGFFLISKQLRYENNLDSTFASESSKFYKEILTNIEKKLENENDLSDKHEIIFEYLHEYVFKKYTPLCYFNQMVLKGEYNCLTATSIYVALCLDLNLKIAIMESPQHVYLVFEDDDEGNIRIELTDPVDGFDFDADKDEYLKYLINYKLITTEELKSKGVDRIYEEYIAKSKIVDQSKLLSMHCNNLAVMALIKEDTEKAFKFISKSLEVNQDSVTIETFILISSLHILNIGEKLSELNPFLFELFKYEIENDTFVETLCNTSTFAISKNFNAGNIELADSIYHLIMSKDFLSSEDSSHFKDLGFTLELSKLESKITRGNYSEAFEIAQNLYYTNQKDHRSEEQYIKTTRTYLYDLYTKSEFDNMKVVATELYNDLSSINSVPDIYVNTLITYVFESKLYLSNRDKSKEIMLSIYKDIPNNNLIKKGLAQLYREFAMEEIRGSNYKEAVKILNEGLEYDPNNYELLKEMELTKQLLKR